MIDGELEERGRSDQRFLILIKNQKEPQNQTITQELGKGGRSNPRFLILIKNQKEPQNQTSMELEKGPKGPWTHIDFMSPLKFKLVLEKETALRELKVSAWRTPEPNVLYSVYCTVQYHAGAINEDEAGFSTVIIEANAGDNESEDKFADTDTEKNLMVDTEKNLMVDMQDQDPRQKLHGNTPYTVPEILLKHAEREPDRGRRLRDRGGQLQWRRLRLQRLGAHSGHRSRNTRGTVSPRRHLQGADPSRQSAEQGSEPAAESSIQNSEPIPLFGTVYSSEGKQPRHSIRIYLSLVRILKTEERLNLT